MPVSVRNRFDQKAYEIMSKVLSSDEPLIAQHGMTIRALRQRERSKKTPEIFHDRQKTIWFLAKKFPCAILPQCKPRMKCQCGPCTYPWHKPGRRISPADCEFDPPCRACRDTGKGWSADVLQRPMNKYWGLSRVETSLPSERIPRPDVLRRCGPV